MTILSRCQKLRFNPLSREEIAVYLSGKLSLDGRTATTLAALAGGSIGRAIEMHKDSYLSVRDGILERISRCCRQGDPVNVFGVVAALGKERESILQGLDILKGWYRDIVVYRETGEVERLIHRDRLETVKVFAGSLSLSEVLENISAVDKAVGAIERNANKQLTLETLLFKLARPFAVNEEPMTAPEEHG
jgi:DNA polymerase-3 subunit delta'